MIIVNIERIVITAGPSLADPADISRFHIVGKNVFDFYDSMSFSIFGSWWRRFLVWAVRRHATKLVARSQRNV